MESALKTCPNEFLNPKTIIEQTRHTTLEIRHLQPQAQHAAEMINKIEMAFDNNTD